MKASFPYKIEPSRIFKSVKRPIVHVEFWSSKDDRFLKYTLIVDTGADYTLFPKVIAKDLGIDLDKDCTPHISSGVGGKEKVFFLKRKIAIMLDKVKRDIPVGFLDRDDIPPLLGRQECLDTFKITLDNFITTFSSEE